MTTGGDREMKNVHADSYVMLFPSNGISIWLSCNIAKSSSTFRSTSSGLCRHVSIRNVPNTLSRFSSFLRRVMRAAADLYSKSLLEFEEDYFTTDDAWARREARADLFSYLDSAREVKYKYSI